MYKCVSNYFFFFLSSFFAASFLGVSFLSSFLGVSFLSLPPFPTAPFASASFFPFPFSASFLPSPFFADDLLVESNEALLADSSSDFSPDLMSK